MLVLFFINPFRCGLKQIYRLGGFYLCRGGTYALTFGTTLKDHVPPGFHPRRAGNARIKTAHDTADSENKKARTAFAIRALNCF